MADKTFSIMTFNIKNSADSIDRQTVNHWVNRREKIVNIVKKYNPTIIGFQEVLHDQYLFLKEKLRDFSSHGVAREDGLTIGEYCPIFFKKDSTILRTQGTFWLSDTPEIPSKTWEGCCPRICSWVALNAPFSMIIANTHFDELFQETRLKSIQVLKNYLMVFHYPLIITGDFNFTRNTIEYDKIVEDLHLEDSFLKGYHKDDLNHLITYHGYTGQKYAENTPRFIDFIFTSTGQRLKEINSEIIYFNEGGDKNAYPSDHFPVYVNFSIKTDYL